MRQDKDGSDDICDGDATTHTKVGDRRAIGSLAIVNWVSVRQSDYMLENICSRHPWGTYHLTVPGQAHVGVRTLNRFVARSWSNRRRMMVPDIKWVSIAFDPSLDRSFFPPLHSLNMSLDFDSVTPSVPKWEADWNAAESRRKAHAATLESLHKDSELDVKAWIVRWVSCVVSATFRTLCE
jgi:hypothetical protein